MMDDPKPYRGNLIRDAKMAKDELTKKITNKIEEEKNKAIKPLKRP